LREPSFSVNMVVPHSELVPAAVEVARRINLNSPDSVQSTKKALVLSQSYGHEEVVQSHALSLESKRVYNGANIKVCYTNP
jgi:enoyl-CoA hydratase/carnithine racemase